MTLDEIREATVESAVAASELAGHLGRLKDRLAPLFPVGADTLSAWCDEERERLHALLRMFEQLYDLIGRKLFRGYLLLSGENAAALSAINVARQVEKFGALRSAEGWIELGTTRNRLIHDYTVTSTRQAYIANAAWDDIERLLEAAGLIVRCLREEQLIP